MEESVTHFLKRIDDFPERFAYILALAFFDVPLTISF